jgi:hypothetical protein
VDDELVRHGLHGRVESLRNKLPACGSTVRFSGYKITYGPYAPRLPGGSHSNSWGERKMLSSISVRVRKLRHRQDDDEMAGCGWRKPRWSPPTFKSEERRHGMRHGAARKSTEAPPHTQHTRQHYRWARMTPSCICSDSDDAQHTCMAPYQRGHVLSLGVEDIRLHKPPRPASPRARALNVAPVVEVERFVEPDAVVERGHHAHLWTVMPCATCRQGDERRGRRAAGLLS